MRTCTPPEPWRRRSRWSPVELGEAGDARGDASRWTRRSWMRRSASRRGAPSSTRTTRAKPAVWTWSRDVRAGQARTAGGAGRRRRSPRASTLAGARVADRRRRGRARRRFRVVRALRGGARSGARDADAHRKTDRAPVPVRREYALDDAHPRAVPRDARTRAREKADEDASRAHARARRRRRTTRDDGHGRGRGVRAIRARRARARRAVTARRLPIRGVGAAILLGGHLGLDFARRARRRHERQELRAPRPPPAVRAGVEPNHEPGRRVASAPSAMWCAKESIRGVQAVASSA